LEVLLIASPGWRHVPWFSCDPVNDHQNEDKNAPSFSASGTTLKRPLMSAEGLAPSKLLESAQIAMKLAARNARKFAIVAKRTFARSAKFEHEDNSYASAHERQ
jgi:hypothetical protein